MRVLGLSGLRSPESRGGAGCSCASALRVFRAAPVSVSTFRRATSHPCARAQKTCRSDALGNHPQEWKWRMPSLSEESE